MIKYGTHANIENVEKKRTIIGPLSPLSPSFLTQVYAKPAHIPPAKPITAAGVIPPAKLGFTINKLPTKAAITHAHCVGVIFSFSTK